MALMKFKPERKAAKQLAALVIALNNKKSLMI